MKKTYRKLKQYTEKYLPGYSLIDKYKIYIKYMVSGGTAATTDLALLFIFTDIFGIWYVISAALAFALAFFVSFYLQKFWTFRDNDIKKIKSQMFIYLVVGLANLVINSYGMYLLVDKFGLWYIFAQIIMGATIAVYTFILYNFFIFSAGSALGEKKPKAHSGDKKNILICTGIYPPDIGGPATYTAILQAELPRHGWSVKVVTYADARSIKSKVHQVKSDVIKISRGQNKLLRYLKYVWQVYKLIPWAGVVYAQGPVSEGYPTYLACKLRRKKYILKIVGDYAWEQMQVKSRKLKVESRDASLPRLEKSFISPNEFQNKKFDKSTERKRKIEHKVAKQAEKIIVPSEYLKKIVKQWGVEDNKIKVIYNAVEFQDVAAKQKPINEKWIVSVGRLVPWKGMDTLIEVFKILNIEYLILNIIGAGPELENLKNKVKRLGLEEKIKLLGKLPRDEAMAYVKAADVFALNTGYEGLPHTIIEAQSLGTPVITTNICGNPEVVENNKTGLLVEYNNKEEINNAILKLLNNKELASELASNAKNNIGKFNKQNMINNIIEVLRHSHSSESI